MKLISVLSGNGFVMYNKALAHTVSVNGAIIFGQLCSSYESFGSKGMLTIKDGKEYFFLTSDTLEEETALSYKKQLKAIKELEQAGYVETKVMGVPSKKYFCITDKIVQELLSEVNPSSSEREDLDVSTNPETAQRESQSSLSKRETLALPKGNGKPVQKGSTIKKKNKKEQDKNNKDNIIVNNSADAQVNNLTLNMNKMSLFKKQVLESVHKYQEFSTGRWDKKTYLDIVNKFMYEAIERGIHLEVNCVDSYVYGFLKKTAHHHDMKYGKKDFEGKSDKVLMYNWLEENTGDLPY
ncbi:hypothetical protein [Bacillus mycoides]|uniref:Replication initiator A N-terminal domain-containing protein n=1 Tax=Bacillus mycoides TaxID=1405 RepID=A0ABX6ZA67_BACMY|nr:hypothetical protein [Bacillus mycoides]AJH17633.1 hypothetical protein BG05_5411 [Bacillus mycoides]EEL96109.1 hypothetical protein bmyco0001_54700 [Bacillus mycoides DSM 2048]MDR4240300.1 hypothetical protein [Bacillus mycoides]MED1426487.1 hypothetical protein [Bacillus mycoides]MED1487544.1 hypothetical protein [Bacillus mycoides]